MSRLPTTYLTAVALLLTACGSDGGTGPTPPDDDQITATQRAQLTQLISDPAVVEAMVTGVGESGMGGFALPLLAGNLGGIGTVSLSSAGEGGPPAGSYSAFGAQINLTFRSAGEDGELLRFVWNGFVAVDNLASPQSVVSAGVVDFEPAGASTSVPSTPIAAEELNRLGFGSWVDLSQPNGVGYLGTSGSVAISNASFGSSTACPVVPGTVTVTTCTIATGTMSGSFNFVASPFGGGASTTVPNTSLSVPAVQLTIEVSVP